MNARCVAAVAGLLCASASLAGDEVELELYTGPAAKETVRPIYPELALRSLREGWVHAHFMVGADGRAYEIAITDSMGDPAFARATVRSIEKSVYEPAKLNGSPIDAGYARKYYFEIQGGVNAARGSFLRTYRRIGDAIAAGNRQLAGTLVEELSARNHYEEALLHLARFHYLREWGEAAQQLQALDRAIAHEKTAKYLPEQVFISALVAHFGLLAHTRDFARALETYETLQDFELDDHVLTALQADAKQIRALKSDNRAYSVGGEIDTSANWYYDLFKDDFAVLDVDGDVAEVKLRCDRKYVFWRFDPEVVYHVNDDYGDCHLTLVGDPGTTFQLRQM